MVGVRDVWGEFTIEVSSTVGSTVKESVIKGFCAMNEFVKMNSFIFI